MAHIQLVHSGGPAPQSSTRGGGSSVAATETIDSATPFGILLAHGLDALDAEETEQNTAQIDVAKTIDAKSEQHPDFTRIGDDSTQMRAATGKSDAVVNEPSRDSDPSDQASEFAQLGIAPPMVTNDESAPREDTDSASRRPATNVITEADFAGHQEQRTSGSPTPPTPITTGTDIPAPLQPNNHAVSPLLVQPTTLATTPAHTSTVITVIHEPVGQTNAWAESLSRNVIVAVGRNENLAEIRVTPPHLGPIEVSVSMSGDDAKVATVHFSAHHVTAKEAIEHAMPRLREMFAEAGISLGNATVDSGSPDNRAGSERSGHNASNNHSRDTAASDERPQADVRLGVLPGKVDTFA